MALANTHLDPYRLSYDESNLDKYENRFSTYGAFKAYQDDTLITVPGADELVAQYDGSRVVSLIVLNRQTLTTSEIRVCTMTTNQPTSTYVTPSWTTIVASFKMVPSEHKGNYLKYQRIFDFQMTTVERTFLAAMDTAAYTSLEANHSTVNAAANNPYAVAADSMIVPAADNDLFFNEMIQVMLTNDLPVDDLNVIASPRLSALVREYGNQGTGNDENRQFQFPPYNFYYSPRVTVAAGDRDTVFVAPKGSLFYLSYVDEDSKLGSIAGEHEWSEQFLPRLGHNVGLLHNSDCGDMSSLGGGTTTASKYESYQFSYDYSFNVAYASAAGAVGTPIFKSNFTVA